MSPAPPRFFFDYIDPASFMLEIRLRRVEQELGRTVERHPVELRVPPDPVMDPSSPGWSARWESAHAIAEEEGIPLARPRLVPWSRKAHELGLEARDTGAWERVHDALFRAYHQEGRDIGRVDVLVDVATAHGLDRTATRAVLDVDRHLDPLLELRREAERLGVPGVPTILAGERFTESLPDLDTLRRALSHRR